MGRLFNRSALYSWRKLFGAELLGYVVDRFPGDGKSLSRSVQSDNGKRWAAFDYDFPFFPFCSTEDAVTKMICALRSRRQPIDCFSYPKIYKQLLV